MACRRVARIVPGRMDYATPDRAPVLDSAGSDSLCWRPTRTKRGDPAIGAARARRWSCSVEGGICDWRRVSKAARPYWRNSDLLRTDVDPGGLVGGPLRPPACHPIQLADRAQCELACGRALLPDRFGRSRRPPQVSDGIRLLSQVLVEASPPGRGDCKPELSVGWGTAGRYGGSILLYRPGAPRARVSFACGNATQRLSAAAAHCRLTGGADHGAGGRRFLQA